MSGSMFGSWFVPQSQPDLGSDINPDVNRLWAAMQANPVGTSQLHPQTAGNATPIDPVAGRWNGQPVTQGQMDALPANLLTGQLNPSGADVVNGTLGMMCGIKAYHGSPHNFDAFSLGKIGTGEGAQAFGHGLYFAQNENVAKGYQAKPSAGGNQELRIDGHLVRYRDNMDLYTAASMKLKGADRFSKYEKWIDSLESDSRLTPAEAASRRAAVEKVRDAKIEEPKNGSLYSVSLDVEPEDLLDWDKPISQQPEKIKRALQNILPPPEIKQTRDGWQVQQGGQSIGMPHLDKADAERFAKNVKLGPLVDGRNAKGQDIIQKLGSLYGQANLSEKLNKAGIYGIRYFDAMSRNKGEGTHNVVLFDDSKVKITAKDGKPVSPEERADAIEQSQEGDKPLYALTGRARPKPAAKATPQPTKPIPAPPTPPERPNDKLAHALTGRREKLRLGDLARALAR